jgi:hypothetical protein
MQLVGLLHFRFTWSRLIPRAGLDDLKEEAISFPCRKLSPRFFDNPPRSLVSTSIEPHENYVANIIYSAIQEMPHILWNAKLFVMFGRVQYCTILRDVEIHFRFSYPINLYIFYICLMLSSHLHLGLASGFFLSTASSIVRLINIVSRIRGLRD